MEWIQNRAGASLAYSLVDSLRCNRRPSVEWYDSLEAFVHEVNHSNYRKPCIFSPFSKESNVCFDLAPGLPNRGVAALAEFKYEDPAVVNGLTLIQKLYLTDYDQPPTILFDELNAYTLTTAALEAILSERGSKAVFNPDEGGKRTGVFLPLFLLYSVRYLDYVKSHDPAAYQRNFGAGSANLKAIVGLLNQGELTFQSWLKTLKASGNPVKPYESDLWGKYLEARRELGI